jgi:hypothetical protein
MPGAVPDPGRGGDFPELFDAMLADAGITVVRTGVRMPRMNAIVERWVQACRSIHAPQRQKPYSYRAIWPSQNRALHVGSGLRECGHVSIPPAS